MAGSSMHVSALGVDVTVTFDPGLSHEATERLSGPWAAAAGRPQSSDDRPGAELVAGLTPQPTPRSDVVTVLGADLSDLASRLSSHVTLAAIEQQRGRLVMLHACGISTDDGAVLAFVGPSGRGKTTLAASLSRAFGYVTDETVGITEAGTVLPYRKPLSVIDPTSVSTAKSQIGPAELGLLPLPDSDLRVAAVILIERDPDAPSIPEISPVPLVDAIVRLIPELSYLPSLPNPLQRVARLIDDVGGIVQLRYREAEQVAGVVPQLLSKPTARADWSTVGLRTVAPPSPSRPGEAVARREMLDGLRVGERLVLLHGTEVTVLDGIGPALWDALEAPATPAELTRAVVAALGAPVGADPGPLVAQAVEQLVGAGILHRAGTEDVPA